MAGVKRLIDIPSWESGTIFGPQSAPKQDVYTASQTQNFAAGTRYVEGDRIFRYARSSGIVGAALMTQTQEVVTNTENIAQTGHTWSAGDTSGTVLVATGGTWAANEFANGIFYVNDGAATAQGDVYNIIASEIQSTDTIMNIELDTPIRNALVATDDISLIPNRFYDTVVFPAAQTGSAAGVALIDLVAGDWFWAQTGGPAPLQVDTSDTFAIGASVGSAAATAVAGAGGLRVTLEQPWGYVALIGADGEAGLVYLTLE